MMQSDAHMEYVKDWDLEMIGQWKLTNNGKCHKKSTKFECSNN